jgi:ubiquinone/menaquinone biosynthesis C-methylase UbiE
MTMVERSALYLHHGKCRVVLSNGVELPFASNSFDFVYSFTCFQHMPTIEIVRANIREAHRVLRYSGICSVQTVKGVPDPALYDGVVFPDVVEFEKEFEQVGFKIIDAHLDRDWIWVTGRK